MFLQVLQYNYDEVTEIQRRLLKLKRSENSTNFGENLLILSPKKYFAENTQITSFLQEHVEANFKHKI